jgi:hypothetical protein
MKRSICFVLIAAAIGTTVTVCVRTAMAQEDAEKMAMQAMDNFLTGFNAKDPAAWAASLNYPHVRFASGSVTVWENAEDFAKNAVNSFERLQAAGWDHSTWDSRDAIHVTENKVHIVVEFSRFTEEDKRFATFQSLYIVTKKDGHWGTQARSSFAP